MELFGDAYFWSLCSWDACFRRLRIASVCNSWLVSPSPRWDTRLQQCTLCIYIWPCLAQVTCSLLTWHALVLCAVTWDKSLCLPCYARSITLRLHTSAKAYRLSSTHWLPCVLDQQIRSHGPCILKYTPSFVIWTRSWEPLPLRGRTLIHLRW